MATTTKHSISIVGAGLNFEISIFHTNVAFVCFTFAEISNVAHVEWQTCVQKNKSSAMYLMLNAVCRFRLVFSSIFQANFFFVFTAS